MVEKKDLKTMTKQLRTFDPELYQYIVQELNDRHNIHTYDVEALASEDDSGLTITLRYGENYAQTKQAPFTYDALKSRNDDLIAFIYEAADDCKRVMVADYFRMMKP